MKRVVLQHHTNERLNIPPIRFKYGKVEAMYLYPATQHTLAGWLIYRSTNLVWTVLRKATDRDIESLTEAVMREHHADMGHLG